jgi:DNA segregation ATPase FtsK/SpoIIIE-like protein
MSVFFEKFRRDVFGVIWLATSLFVGLALFSFRPADPSFNTTGVGLQVHNYCGYIGSFSADLVYQVWGLSAWLLVFAGIRFCIQAFREKKSDMLGARLFACTLLLVTLSSLASLYFPAKRLFDSRIPVGGLVGTVVSHGLVSAFNYLGASIILWSVTLLLLVFYTEKSLKDIFRVPLSWVGHFFQQLAKKILPTLAAVKRSLELPHLRPQLQAPGGGGERALRNEAVREKQRDLGRDLSRNSSLGSQDSDRESSADAGSVSEKKRGGFSILGLGSSGKSSSGKTNTAKNESETALTANGAVAAANSAAGAHESSVVSSNEPAQNSNEAGGSSAYGAGGANLPVERRKVRLNAKVERRVENWKLPDIHLLEDPPLTRIRLDEREINRKAQVLVDKLGQFSVKGEIVHAKPGPAVTMYEFKPKADVKISKITELADDLSLALSSESVRIIAPIPGRDVVGIETSNSQRETVYLKDILANDSFWADSMKLPLCLGRQADGESKVVDLRKMPHLMVAGTTGSGKSVFVVSAITGLLFKHSPKSLRLILIDPKQVDLASFNDIPHLLMPPIREPKKAVSALKWAIREMDKRYRSMSRFGARGLETYNEVVAKLSKEQLEQHELTNTEWELDARKLEQYYFTPQPYIVIVVEEFGDLMAVDKANVENLVVRLAQMARACGIHLILAMQSPRKDVVTGLIKTNIPGRISFKVASKMDSRIILDESGAERLLPNGDLLFLAPGVSKPQRHHAPWVTEAEIAAVMRSWCEQGEPQYDLLAMRALEGSGGGFDLGGGAGEEEGGFGGGGDENEYDDRYDEVLAYVSGLKEVSASLLQRRFKLGYPRAARLVELFEREGVVGPANGSKPRPVLVTQYGKEQ